MSIRFATGLACLSIGIPAPAQAASDTALLARIEAMQAEIDRLRLEAEAIRAEKAVAPPPAPAPAVAASADPAPAPQVDFRGAPRFTAEGGWSFKPRGRLQVDAGTLAAPASITDRSKGTAVELRRAFVGFEGEMPGGFGYRAEVDVAGSSVEITDLYLTYQATEDLEVLVGQTKPFWGLDELTSDLFTSFTERAAFNSAFGYERRVGLAATWNKGPLMAQAGLFADNAADLGNDENNAMSLDARVVLAPKVGDLQLHLAGSLHLRDLNDGASSVRYRARPFIHTLDIRFIDTGNIAAAGETGYGFEAAAIQGRFHAAAEASWQKPDLPGTTADPTFFGAYAEVGLFLTDDTRGYRNGAFDRIRPKTPLGAGGIGAVQVNLRYDHLDLVDAGVTGGLQDAYMASVVWTPTDNTRFMINYGRIDYDLAAIAAGIDRSFAVDTFGLRAQFDF